MKTGDKIKNLRLEKNWTQNDLAKKIDSSIKQICLYEQNSGLPSADKLIKLAKALNVSIDYLLLDKVSNESSDLIKDRSLLDRFKIMESLQVKEKEFILRVIDCLLLEQDFKKISDLKNKKMN